MSTANVADSWAAVWRTAIGASMQDALRVMAGIDASVVNEASTPIQMPEDRVAAEIAFEGSVKGKAVLFANFGVATGIVAALLGRSVGELGVDDVQSGVCELLNVVLGGAKARIAGAGGCIEMKTPLPLQRGTSDPDESDAIAVTVVWANCCALRCAVIRA